jgi:hypothetical protein
MKNLNWIIQPLTLFAAAMLVLLNILLFTIWYLPAISNLSSATHQLGNSLVRNLAYEATSALHSKNRVSLNNLLNRVADQESVILATVIANETGNRLSSRQKNTTETGILFKAPIQFSNELLGHAEVHISEKNIQQWKKQAINSWLIFNIVGIFGLGLFLYLRYQSHMKEWESISTTIREQLPAIGSQLKGRPEQQLKQLFKLLNQPMQQHGKLMQHLNQSHAELNTERLFEQVEVGDEVSQYLDVALVSVECQNWEQLIRIYDANELQQLWQGYEQLMIQVSELYKGIVLPDGLTLAFGLTGADEYALDALCSAQVIHIAQHLIGQSLKQLPPAFGIAVSSGPAFISRTHKHGLPLPMVAGDAGTRLAQIKALQPTDQIFLAEPILQHPEVNDKIEANLVRDITLRDGQRLEVWELDAIKGMDELLYKQARTLADNNKI